MSSIYILTAIFIWSSLGIIIRMADTALTNTIFFPALIALIAQCTILFSTGERKKLPELRNIPTLFLLGPFFLLNNLFFYYAFTHTTIANAVLTHYTAPIFVAVLSPLLLKERIDRFVVLAIIVSSAGLWLMLNGFSYSDENISGITAGVLSGVAYALIIIIGRFLTRNYSILIITIFQNLVVVLLLFPFVNEIPLEIAGYLVLMGLLHSTVAPLLYIKGLQKVRATKAAVLGYLEPVGAMLLALIFYSEAPGFRSLMGGFLIIFSGYIIIIKHSGKTAGEHG
ncbi:MAG: DMT family transporter [Nitrospirota bacterium]|nr:DMT family transporter [Nitrospirota bacterium]